MLRFLSLNIMSKRFKQKIPKQFKLDLHGVKHADVEVLVENFIFKYQEDLPIKIVTGNSNAMKKIVINVLNKHNFSYLDGDFYNRGYIDVLN